MKKLILILLFNCFSLFGQENKVLVEFINANTSMLYGDLISITVLDYKEQVEDYYNSKTYFTTEGYILLPYDEKGINLIIGACDNTLYYYILPDIYRTTFLLNTCNGDY